MLSRSFTITGQIVLFTDKFGTVKQFTLQMFLGLVVVANRM